MAARAREYTETPELRTFTGRILRDVSYISVKLVLKAGIMLFGKGRLGLSS